MSTAVAMRRLLMHGVAEGYLRLFDVQLANKIASLDETAHADLLLAVALCSYATGRGDTCLSFTACAQFDFFTAESEQDRLDLATEAGLRTGDRRVLAPLPQKWRECLLAQTVVGEQGAVAPLIVHGDDHLYLGRYFELEQRLIERLRYFIAKESRLLSVSRSGDQSSQHGWQKLSSTLRRIFKPDSTSATDPLASSEADTTDWQKVAAAIGATTRLSIITGGPGTGKTYTVAALLTCLTEPSDSRQGDAENSAAPQRPRIALAAPTGKAATRLTDSIRKVSDTLEVPDSVKDAIRVEAQTLHRLLGIIPGRVTPRYHRGRRLPFDVVIVDEASMVDLPLMARLFDALADDASIVLLGDKDQLSSVESGMVLGDICGDRSSSEFDRPLADAIKQVTDQTVPAADTVAPISNNIVYLHRSYRSQDSGGISALARSINEGNAQQTIELLRGSEFNNVTLADHNQLSELLKSEVMPVYRDLPKTALTNDNDIERCLEVLSGVSVLCALRRGRHGAAGINEAMRRMLNPVEQFADGGHYAGRPVMIRENSTPTRLYNGDTGLILPVKAENSDKSLLRVFFAGGSGDAGAGNYRSFATARMPEHETAYAMTIHKSQGSEFETVVVVLPEDDSPLLSRELLYTAVTRAKKRVVLVATEEVLRIAVARRAVRQSGLREALWPAAAEPKLVETGTVERVIWDSATRGSEVSEREVRQREVRQPQVRETDAGKPEAREFEAREPESREPETREPETREPETGEPEATEHRRIQKIQVARPVRKKRSRRNKTGDDPTQGSFDF